MKRKIRRIKDFFRRIDYRIYLAILGSLIIVSLSIWKLGILKGLLFVSVVTATITLYYFGGKFIMSKKKRKRNGKPITSNTNNKNTNQKNKKTTVNASKNNNSKKVVVNKKKVKGKHATNIARKLIAVFLILGIVCVLLFGAFMTYIVMTAPKFDPKKFSYRESSVVYDKDGNEAAILAVEKREKVDYDELPQVLVDALIATEDSRFYQHDGFDLPRFIKATMYQVMGKDEAGGASTLSMQVIKNNFTDAKQVSGIKGILRKFTDIYMSVFQLEKKYTKEQIIEFYVNDSLLGVNNYGVEQASQYYFGKSVRDLSLTEAALLIGLYQSPNQYNPYKYPEAATARRATVLNLMVRHGYITKEEADIAKAIPVSSLLNKVDVKDTEYQGYIDTVIEEVIAKTGQNPYDVSMKIYTTMDRSVQDGINNIINGKTYNWANDAVQTGIAITNVETGAIVAVGAGRNKTGARNYNLATMVKEHPGSTAKPIFDYGPGFEYNNFSTYTLFNDEYWTYSGTSTEVHNWDNSHMGLITLRTALSVSRNVPALKAFQQVDKKNIEKFVRSIGIEPQLENGYLHEAHAIGAFDGVSPLQMAAAYAAFGSGGYYTAPYTVTKIVYRATNEEVEYKPKKERVMADSTAYLMNNVLQFATEYGFSGGARVPGVAMATKTGTSNFDDATMAKYKLPGDAVNDLWTVSYSPQYSVAMWYGYESINDGYHSGNYNYWKDGLMAAIVSTVPKTNKTFTIPSSVVTSEVEFGTVPAMLPSEYTPADLIRREVFKRGTEPTEVSPRFKKLDPVTNLNATYSNANSKVKLTWNDVTPNQVSTTWIQSYFNQPTFGNGKANFAQGRIDYINNTMGGYGYGVYLKNSSNQLTSLGWTKDNSFEYDVTGLGSSTLTFVVKAEYGTFKGPSSNEVSKNVQINESSVSMTFTSNNSNLKQGGVFAEIATPITVKANNTNVSSSCTYKAVSVKKGSTTTNVDTSNTLASLIDTSATVGTVYTITYDITYNGNTYTKTRNVTITAP